MGAWSSGQVLGHQGMALFVSIRRIRKGGLVGGSVSRGDGL